MQIKTCPPFLYISGGEQWVTPVLLCPLSSMHFLVYMCNTLHLHDTFNVASILLSKHFFFPYFISLWNTRTQRVGAIFDINNNKSIKFTNYTKRPNWCKTQTIQSEIFKTHNCILQWRIGQKNKKRCRTEVEMKMFRSSHSKWPNAFPRFSQRST